VTARVTAYLCADPASDAIAFYTAAFGAVEAYRMEDGGRIGHAELTIGDTTLYISDTWPEMGVKSPLTLGGNSVSFVLDVPDVDTAFQRAVTAGATIERPIADAPYARGGWVRDPFGHRWSIQTSNPNFKP
jgi:PhnB protein